MSFFPLLYIYATVCIIALTYTLFTIKKMHPSRDRWPLWMIVVVMIHYLLLCLEAWTIYAGFSDMGVWVRFGWIVNGIFMLISVCALILKYGEDHR